MSNRFSQIPQDYEHVSSYIPLPLDYIQKSLDAKQATYDKGMAAIDEMPAIVGGNVTKDHAKELEDFKNKEIQAMVDEADKTGYYGDLPRKTKKLWEYIKSTKKYQGIQEDIALSPEASKNVTLPGFPTFIQGYYDNEKGKWEQLKSGQDFTPNVYRTLTPGDMYKEYLDFTSNVKEDIKNTPGISGLQEFQGEDGRSYMKFIQNGEEVTRLTKDMVKDKALSAIKANRQSMLNKESMIYQNELYRRLTGKDISDDDAAKMIARTYPGYYDRTKETQKITNLPKDSGGYTNRYGDVSKNNVPNMLVSVIAPDKTTITQSGLRGIFPEVTDNGPQKGSYQVNLDGSIAQMAKTPDMSNEDANVLDIGSKLENIKKDLGIEYKGKYDKIEDYNKAALTEFVVNNKEELGEEEMPSEENNWIGWRYEIGDIYSKNPDVYIKVYGDPHKGGGDIGDVEYNYPNDPGPVISRTKVGRLDDMINETLNSNEEYQDLLIEADQKGIDIKNNKFIDEFNKLSNQEMMHANDLIGRMLNIAGTGNFYVDQSGKENKYNIGDKVFVKGWTEFTRENLDEYFAAVGIEEWEDMGGSDWGDLFVDKDARYKGLIKFSKKGKTETEDLYKVSSWIQIPVSTQSSSAYNAEYYGQSTIGKEGVKNDLDTELGSMKVYNMQERTLGLLEYNLKKSNFNDKVKNIIQNTINNELRKTENIYQRAELIPDIQLILSLKEGENIIGNTKVTIGDGELSKMSFDDLRNLIDGARGSKISSSPGKKVPGMRK